MAEDKADRALKVLEALCEEFDNRQWHYQMPGDEMQILCRAQGNDLPIDIIFEVDADRQLISLFSPLPFIVSEEKRRDAAIAAAIVNSRLIDGEFRFSIADGHIIFLLTNSFAGREIGKAVFTDMFVAACKTVDDYNDKFARLECGLIGIRDFISEN